MAPPRIYKNFISGEWVESASGRTFENVNPANRHELIGIFQKSNVEDVETAVAAAKEAYKTWRLVPAPKRAEVLFRAARLLSERKEMLAEQMTSEMGKVLEEAGVPRGVVNFVTGGGGEVGQALMTHSDVRVVSFTGSTEVGRQVSKACADTFKHVCLEMGGKNVIMVMDDANLDLAVDGAIWGGFGTTGQPCTAARPRVGPQKSIGAFPRRFHDPSPS